MANDNTSSKPSEQKLRQSDMKDRAAKWPDASAGKQKGPMVSEGATRDGVAKTPGTLDGRTA